LKLNPSVSAIRFGRRSFEDRACCVTHREKR
jgi:hypothetical protein